MSGPAVPELLTNFEKALEALRQTHNPDITESDWFRACSHLLSLGRRVLLDGEGTAIPLPPPILVFKLAQSRIDVDDKFLRLDLEGFPDSMSRSSTIYRTTAAGAPVEIDGRTYLWLGYLCGHITRMQSEVRRRLQPGQRRTPKEHTRSEPNPNLFSKTLENFETALDCLRESHNDTITESHWFRACSSLLGVGKRVLLHGEGTDTPPQSPMLRLQLTTPRIDPLAMLIHFEILGFPNVLTRTSVQYRISASGLGFAEIDSRRYWWISYMADYISLLQSEIRSRLQKEFTIPEQDVRRGRLMGFQVKRVELDSEQPTREEGA